MSVMYTPDSAYAKEMVKWEANYTIHGAPQRPYVKRDFPMMVHRAQSETDRELEQETCEKEEFLPSFIARGFRETPLEALEAAAAQQLEYAKLAAERAYDVKHKLSEKAGAEVAAAEAQQLNHLPSVPVTPLPPRRAGGLADWQKPKEK